MTDTANWTSVNTQPNPLENGNTNTKETSSDAQLFNAPTANQIQILIGDSNKNNIIEDPLSEVKIIKKGNDNSKWNISYKYLFKVTFIGDSGTGKTSILTRFIDNVFKEENSATIGVDFKIVSFLWNNEDYAKMQIWDTCGSERFRSLTASFLKTCSAFILTFDWTRMATFNSIETWIKLINETTTPKYLILIGNKSDLLDQRQVSKEMIWKFCKSLGVIYVETSAKNNWNVELIFREVAKGLYGEIKKKMNLNDGDMKEFEVGGFKNIKVENNVKTETINKKKGCC